MVPDTVGVILAGGQARRMGGVDKALMPLGGTTLIERAIARAAVQVTDLIINSNGDPARFAHLGLPVIADRVPGFVGPLAGILAGFEWMRANRPRARWLASFACDCPFFPLDMVARLVEGARSERASVAVAASSSGQHHPVFAVWSADITSSSEDVLVQGGFRKMDDFIATLPNLRVSFAAEPIDPFLNINTPEELARAEDFIVEQGAMG
jgi:molybdopterin-guanine dinucleotide biosynthesis protein A